MENLDNNDLIERYLDGSLSGDALAAVEARLATDPAFREDLELHRQLHAEFADPKKLQLRDMLSDIMQQEPAPPAVAGPNWLKIGGIVLIALLGIWGISRMLTPGPNNTPVKSDLPEQTPTQQKAVDPDTLAKQPTYAAPNPIAIADKAAFKPNPVFEARLGNGGIRSTDDTQVKMQSPAEGADFISVNGLVALRFKGTVTPDDSEETAPLQLNIYQNRSADTPVKQLEPSIANRNQQSEKWGFSANESLRLSPGLYYYTIERKADAELIFVGRFTVDKN